MAEMVVVLSGDYHSFLVAKEVAMKLPKYKEWVENNPDKNFRLKLNHRRMGKWLDFCKNLVCPSVSKVFEQSFVNDLDALGLYFMIQDAHEYGFKILMDLACRALVNKVKGKTEEEIMKEFAINQGRDSFDNSIAKLIWRLQLVADASVVASEDQQGLSQGLMRYPELSTFMKDSTFMDFWDPYLSQKIPQFKKSVPDFEECIDHFMTSSEFMRSKESVLSSDQMSKLLEATKRLQQSIDGDGRPFLNIGLNADFSKRLIQILQTQTVQMEKIQCVAASILSRALMLPNVKSENSLYKDAFAVVEKGIPVVVNLMFSSSIPLLEQILNTLTLFIADHPRCMKVILNSGALEAAQSIVSHCTADEILCNLARFLVVVCYCGNLNSDQEDRVLNIIKEIYLMPIPPKDFYRILPYSSCKVTATHALAYLSNGKYVAIEEAVLERLVEFISRPSFTDASLSNGDTVLPEIAVGVVGNIVRWGSSDQIKYLKDDCKLLQCLGSSLPCCKVKKFQVEACRIIFNIAAQSNTLIKELDEAGLKEALCTLVDANDCDVKVEAVLAIYNCIYGYKLKRLTTVFKNAASDY